MDKPFLRIFCQLDSEDDTGYHCVIAAIELGFGVRVISCGGPTFVAGERWAEHEKCLIRPVPDEFINVVCGDEDERERLYTDGVENVAIICEEAPPVITRPYQVVAGEKGFKTFLTSLLA